MKYYLINIKRDNNGKYIYPDAGQNYKNRGYNKQKTKCIWEAKEGLFLDNEITKGEAMELLSKWEQEREKARKASIENSPCSNKSCKECGKCL